MNKIISIILMLLSITYVNGNDRSRVRLGRDIIVEKGDSYDSVVSLGGNITVHGRVKESAVAIGGNVFVKNSGIVEDAAVVIGGEVFLAGNGKVGEDIIEIEGGNIGQIFRRSAGWSNWHLPFIFRSFSLIGTLIIALISVLIFPGFIESISLQLKKLPGKSLLYGFLALVLLVPGTILLALSLIGIPFIPILLFTYFLSYFLGYFAVSKILGQRLLASFSSLLHLTVLISVLGSFITSRINLKIS